MVHGDAQEIFPGITAQWNGKAMLSTPFTDPNFLCSYSYWKPGQYTGFSGYEGVRQGNIHFAGEHCSTSFQGFMEGGASEGVRAANAKLISATTTLIPAATKIAVAMLYSRSR